MFDPARPFGRNLWGLILAAGDGKRLRDHVTRLTGKQLPKQFVNIIGTRSMLEHTYERAQKLIDADQVMTIVSRHHLRHAEVRDQLGRQRKQTIIVQPENKETALGILLSLMFLKKRCPEAVVALFPSDHFILEEERFMIQVGLAVEAVTDDPRRLVLLGIPPRRPEIDYGYIMPSEATAKPCPFGTKPIRAFLEKPSAQRAHQLIQQGALWNTMTMVFQLNSFLQLVRAVQPGIQRRFDRLLGSIDTPRERSAIEGLYRALSPMNFSTTVMERLAQSHRERLSVLAVQEVFWSDWGSPERIEQTLNALGQPWTSRTFIDPRPRGTTLHAQRGGPLVASPASAIE